ncbi:hypothetical protein XCR1_790007 [Xenorhabdus cabanillasii JM26]|uniref:Transposase DDE domain-containing protein n=1 Tax=Xenorhabdus cabanillasii JM26 TaxID=1427517 RepID=W1JBI6_9GAMM|nr:transposase [Xenorhabdus cabanillasii]CDL86860.1 hypothetical protein XCR1_790007 [Xenorhabdus cabanillasii JM26]
MRFSLSLWDNLILKTRFSIETVVNQLKNISQISLHLSKSKVIVSHD